MSFVVFVAHGTIFDKGKNWFWDKNDSAKYIVERQVTHKIGPICILKTAWNIVDF